MVAREPNGRPQRRTEAQLPSPAEIARLRDAALAGLRDPAWGSTLGRLYLSGKVTGTQFAAGKRWAKLAARYSSAAISPKQPRSAKLAAEGGSPVDPDSAKGRREALQEANLAASYVEALVVLERMGALPRRAVVNACEYGINPVGVSGLHDLQKGLQGLVAWWIK
jgi:hypothetical protein